MKEKDTKMEGRKKNIVRVKALKPYEVKHDKTSLNYNIFNTDKYI